MLKKLIGNNLLKAFMYNTLWRYSYVIKHYIFS